MLREESNQNPSFFVFLKIWVLRVVKDIRSKELVTADFRVQGPLATRSKIRGGKCDSSIGYLSRAAPVVGIGRGFEFLSNV